MEAQSAREIAKTSGYSMKAILFSVECMAKNGGTKATFDKSSIYISEREIKELVKLGYTIVVNDRKYLSITW